ncbi:hypothetical protein predicted by Glimmer/Critica [Bdellovibrio bacteriovorus HD100]|uniref:Uncharacterized protein n=1 Tax=Bdellovibrio bacteriovorus (strain ATCC 15356 / DSM 50701 / NCIMB 9529 / HD100) TaxID=264462 RepID=Q6MQQ8_BDEBA|nr:hypothetical protein predicted by Glimmer/Critica [Bdellovibrio bacteriovorus HD100]
MSASPWTCFKTNHLRTGFASLVAELVGPKNSVRGIVVISRT